MSNHIAVQRYVPEDGDKLLRRGNKYPIHCPPLPAADDVTLPVQCPNGMPPLCFGDRILCVRDRRIIDPLAHVSWPSLKIGDTVLVTPVDGDICLMNREPTLVRSVRTNGERHTYVFLFFKKRLFVRLCRIPGVDARDALCLQTCQYKASVTFVGGFFLVEKKNVFLIVLVSKQIDLSEYTSHQCMTP